MSDRPTESRPAAPGWADEPPAWDGPAPAWLDPVEGGAIRPDTPLALRPEAEVAPATGWLRSIGLVGGAGALLLLGGGALWLGLMLDDLFAVSPGFGWAGVALGGAVAGLLSAAAWREWRALRRLSALDHLAEALQDAPDNAPPPAALLRWVEGIGRRLPEAAGAAAQIRAARTLGEARGLVAGLLMPLLQARVKALGGQAARRVFLATAILPSPALDAAAMALIGLRLMRQVAELNGLRPGTLVLGRLVRRLAFSTGLTIGTDMAVEAGLEQVIEGHAAKLAGGAAGAAVAARRMTRLAQATFLSVTPFSSGLPPSGGQVGRGTAPGRSLR